MSMTRRDKVGAVILVLLFVTFIVLLIWTYQPKGSASNNFQNNTFVQQRLINLQKSNSSNR